MTKNTPVGAGLPANSGVATDRQIRGTYEWVPAYAGCGKPYRNNAGQNTIDTNIRDNCVLTRDFLCMPHDFL
jgi:hypothetical protein